MRELPCEWTVTVQPVLEPLSLDEAKQHCSISQDDDNALLLGYLKAARDSAQNYCNRALLTQTLRLQLSGFAYEIALPLAAPLQSVSSVQYYDTDGVLQTLSSIYYELDTVSEPACLRLAPNQTYPSVQSERARPVLITYVAGWTSADSVPESIKQGIRILLAASEGGRSGEDAEAARLAAEWSWTSYQVFWRQPICR